MIARIIALVGISGVGKTTLLHKISRALPFQHLSAGTLIAEQRSISNSVIDRDNLRSTHIVNNQELLISGFHRFKNKNSPLIILDGHTVIHTPSGLEPIRTKIFQELGIDQFIFLHADAALIHKYRTMDITRNRPQMTIEELSLHQKRALSITRMIASELCVPCHHVTARDEDRIKSLLL